MWSPERSIYPEEHREELLKTITSESETPGNVLVTLDMSSPNPGTFLLVLLLEAITGLSFSLFTVVCLSVTGTKTKRMSTCNRILMALNISNLCYIFSMFTNFFIAFLWPHLYRITYVLYMVSYTTIYSITSTSWLTCTLCFFYFLKIIPSQPRILTKIKNMTNRIAGGLLLTSEVVSLGGSFLSFLISDQNYIQMNSTEGGAEKLEKPKTKGVTYMNIVMALNSLPFFIIIVTTVISASFLRLYNIKMKKNISNINTKVKDYRTAVQTMTGLLIFYVLIYLIMSIISLNIIGDRTWGFWICVILLFSFPTVQSALLIYGNPKLKEALRKTITFTAVTTDSGQ